MKEKNKILRFAALIRVSTEKQGERGESLRTQETQIRQNIETLGGTIPEGCVYSGQEHSSTGYDRPILDALLADSETDKFDAVMVADTSRFGRDTRTVKAAIDVLHRNGIRLFVGNTEYDMDKPEQRFMLGMLGEVAEFQSRLTTQKSTDNRIELAKRGWPTGGTPLFGRKLKQTANKAGHAEWEIDPEGLAFIRRAYYLYVGDGMGFEKVAKLVGCSETALRNRLMNLSGPVWQQQFKVKGNILTFGVAVPPLLTEDEIDKVKARASVNRSWRKRTRLYPLSLAINCACGAGLSGSTTTRKNGYQQSYYKHSPNNKGDGCVGDVPARLVEMEVFSQIGQMLTRQENLEAAVREALSGSEVETKRLDSEIAELTGQRQAVERDADRLVNTIASGAAGGPGDVIVDKLQAKLKDINDRGNTIKAHLRQLERQRDRINVEVPDELGAQIRSHMAVLIGRNGRSIIMWPIADKKRLVALLFGKREKGWGVFVSVHHHPEGGKYWTYEMKGLLGTTTGVITNKPYLDDLLQPRYASEQPSGKVNAVALGKLFGSLSDQLLQRHQLNGEQFGPNSAASMQGGRR